MHINKKDHECWVKDTDSFLDITDRVKVELISGGTHSTYLRYVGWVACYQALSLVSITGKNVDNSLIN